MTSTSSRAPGRPRRPDRLGQTVARSVLSAPQHERQTNDAEEDEQAAGQLRPLSPEILRAMSEHVLYEIESFGLMTDLLTPHIWMEIPEYVAHGASNAMIESFTIHARSLHDFLYAEPRGDDASAADWFPSDIWEALRG